MLGVDGQPVKRTADLIAAVAAKKPGDKVILQVRGVAVGSAPRSVDLRLGASAREIPLFDAELLYNKAMMDLLGVVGGYPGTEAAAYASAQPRPLRHALLRLRGRARLPADGEGGAAGAARPLPGHRALLPRPRPREAQLPARRRLEAYRAAADAKDATLIDNDGPPVASLAARRAGP